MSSPNSRPVAESGARAPSLTAAVLLDRTDPRPVHFIGIAGAGMSALAELLAKNGIHPVWSAGPEGSTLLHRIDPYEGFDASNWPDDASGWGSDSPPFGELVEAVPLLPGPVRLAARVERDGSRRHVERRGDGMRKRRRQRRMPPELPGDRPDAGGVAVAQPLDLARLATALGVDAGLIAIRSEPEMTALTGYHVHRGCLALVERPAEIEMTGLVHHARTLHGAPANGSADRRRRGRWPTGSTASPAAPAWPPPLPRAMPCWA
mgnify:CR=1 FL=1